MALLHSLSLSSGIDLPNAYAKIDTFMGTKDSMTVDVAWFSSEQARLDEKPSVHRQSYMLPGVPNEDLLTSTYNYLKTLPEFAGAEDC